VSRATDSVEQRSGWYQTVQRFNAFVSWCAAILIGLTYTWLLQAVLLVVLMIPLWWLADFIHWWADLIGPTCAGIVIPCLTLVAALYGTSIRMKARNRRTVAWRSFCLANALLLSLCGWLGLPEQRYQRALDGVVQAQIRLDHYGSIDPSVVDQAGLAAAKLNAATWTAFWKKDSASAIPSFQGKFAFFFAGAWIVVALPFPRPFAAKSKRRKLD
jgi:hypothetical protein